MTINGFDLVIAVVSRHHDIFLIRPSGAHHPRPADHVKAVECVTESVQVDAVGWQGDEHPVGFVLSRPSILQCPK